MNDLDREICKTLYLLHEIKNGPSKLLVKKKNQMLENVALLETRTLRYLAGSAEEDPEELFQTLSDAVAVVASQIPTLHSGRGNPGKTKTSPEDEAIIANHFESGTKVGTLVRQSGGSAEDANRIRREVKRRKKRHQFENSI